VFPQLPPYVFGAESAETGSLRVIQGGTKRKIDMEEKTETRSTHRLVVHIERKRK
jgi:hypothetical protein